MKKIKRTTIKIKKRELVIVRSDKRNDGETIQICPVCHFPVPSQNILTVEEKPKAELPAPAEEEGDERNLTKQI